MAADDTCPAVLSAVALRSYMRATGWTEGTHGSHGSVFTRAGFKVSVPLEDDDLDLIRMAIYRLAVAEKREPGETEAAVWAYRDARGSEVAPGVPAPDDSGRDLPSAHGQTQESQRGDWRELRETVTLPTGALSAAQAVRYGEEVDTCTWDYVAEATLLAAEPLIRADERARIIALSRQLQATFPVDAGEGITDYEAFAAVLERGDEPDCEARAGRAEAKLAEVRAVLLEGGQGDATARCRAIAIIGTGEEAGHG